MIGAANAADAAPAGDPGAGPRAGGRLGRGPVPAVRGVGRDHPARPAPAAGAGAAGTGLRRRRPPVRPVPRGQLRGPPRPPPPPRPGGDTPAPPGPRHTGRKQAIAALAASLVEPEDTVVIDVGTTALAVARALPAGFRGRVLTNSVPAAMELSARSDVELLLCGGQVRAGDGACAGAHAEAFFGEFYADRAFLGSGGVHPEAGLTDYYPAEVAVRRTVIDHTAMTYVL